MSTAATQQEERAETRRALRALNQKLDREVERNVLLPGDNQEDGLLAALDESNAMLERVARPREQVHDTAALQRISHTSVRRGAALNENAFRWTDASFVVALRKFIEEAPEPVVPPQGGEAGEPDAWGAVRCCRLNGMRVPNSSPATMPWAFCWA